VTTAGELGLRPAGPADAEVLYRIYASTREEELSVVPWDAPAKEAFLRMQFTAQHTDYHARYPDASYDLILVGDEVAGRLYVHRGEKALHVLDIALLPEHRGKGIGTRLFTQILAEAGAAAKPVEIYVEQFNPARRLYDRLGFRQIADQGVYLLLEWRSDADESAALGLLSKHCFVTHRGWFLARRGLVRPDRYEEQLD
jgi:ribosomal protein S18 acetylase RimI-like enzyme